jgi:serine/threonine protein kinase/WD40 repeat protein
MGKNDDHIEQGAEDPSRTLDAVKPMYEIGSTIGCYKLLSVLGEGGFGMVYLAEQQRPIKRLVALKLIKPGMDTKQVIARFETERQALAMLDHPNIARVFDAGATEAGRPYFAMEYVKGIPITEYCDRYKLNTQERLRLFIPLCQAIQHAHHKGIIHRDIKPSNALVMLHDEKPIPKIIDFGVAKALNQRLTEKTLFTEQGQFIGTPEYMSPEQAEVTGLDVDTRTDIYSLGVLLYELLTGCTPFDAQDLRSKGYAEMQRIICEQDPVKPSTKLTTLGGKLDDIAKHRSATADQLRKSVRGDLDWIVMKCLEKDRTRRYETANSLAMDIERHLNNEAVLARPPSKLYRFQKLVRRNKGVFATVTVVAAVLVLGVFVSTWQAARATRAERTQTRLRQRAEEGEKQAKATARQLRLRAYAADMRAAQIAIEQNSRGSAARLLARYRAKPGEEDLRGVEWRYLWKRLRGDELDTWQRPGMVGLLRCTADGRHMLSGEEDHKVQVLDSETGRIVRELDVIYRFGRLTIAVSQDRKHIASWENDVLSVHTIPDGRLVAHTRAAGVVWIGLSQEGHLVAAGLNDRILLFRIGGTGEMIQEFSIPRPPGGAAVFTPDGKRLLVGEAVGTTFELREYAIPTGLPLHPDYPPMQLTSETLRLDPTGRYLLSLGMGETSLYLLETHERLWPPTNFHKSPYPPNDVVFSKDGEQFITASYDQSMAMIRTRDGALLGRLRGHQNEVWSIDASPDGQFLFTGSKDETIKKWRWAAPPDTRRVLSEHEVLVPKVRDGDPLLTFDTASQQFSKWSGLERTSWPWSSNLPSIIANWGLVQTGYHFDDPPKLLLLDTSNVLAFCELPGGIIERKVDLGPGEILGMVISNNRQWLALTRGSNRDVAPVEVVSRDSNAPVEVWDLSVGRFVRKLPPLDCTDPRYEQARSRLIVFSKDSRLLAYPDERRDVVLWNLKEDREERRLRGATWWLRHLSFSDDGKQVAAAGAGSIIYLWDVATGSLATPGLYGHTSGVFTVSFSRDGRTLISAGDDDSVRFWSTANGVEMLRLADCFSWNPLSQDDSLLFLRRNWAFQDGGSLEQIPTLGEIEVEEKRLESGQSP